MIVLAGVGVAAFTGMLPGTSGSIDKDAMSAAPKADAPKATAAVPAQPKPAQPEVAAPKPSR